MHTPGNSQFGFKYCCKPPAFLSPCAARSIDSSLEVKLAAQVISWMQEHSQLHFICLSAPNKKKICEHLSFTTTKEVKWRSRYYLRHHLFKVIQIELPSARGALILCSGVHRKLRDRPTPFSDYTKRCCRAPLRSHSWDNSGQRTATFSSNLDGSAKQEKKKQ